MIKPQIKVMMAIRELTQTQLAEMTGISQAAISKMSSGRAKHIPVDDMDALCRVLDCQPSDLFKYIPEEKKEE